MSCNYECLIKFSMELKIYKIFRDLVLSPKYFNEYWLRQTYSIHTKVSFASKSFEIRQVVHQKSHFLINIQENSWYKYMCVYFLGASKFFLRGPMNDCYLTASTDCHADINLYLKFNIFYLKHIFNTRTILLWHITRRGIISRVLDYIKWKILIKKI